MPRMLSTVTLSAWLGYCAVAAFTHGAAAIAGARDGMAAPSSSAWLPAFAADQAIATGFLAIAGLFGAALFLIHVTRGRGAVAAAEGLSLGAFALSGLMLLSDVGAATSMVTAVLVLAASVLAIGLDRAITVDEEDAFDPDAFEAGIVAVAEAMARQTRLYTPQHDDRLRR